MPTRDEIAQVLCDRCPKIQGRCAAICFEFAGSVSGRCPHAEQVHGRTIDAILALGWNEPGLRRAIRIAEQCAYTAPNSAALGPEQNCLRVVRALEAEIKEPEALLATQTSELPNPEGYTTVYDSDEEPT